MADSYVSHAEKIPFPPSSFFFSLTALLIRLARIVSRYGSWRWNGARQKRPMSSIVLEPGVKDMLLADCRDFLCSEEWYAERGEPFFA